MSLSLPVLVDIVHDADRSSGRWIPEGATPRSMALEAAAGLAGHLAAAGGGGRWLLAAVDDLDLPSDVRSGHPVDLECTLVRRRTDAVTVAAHGRQERRMVVTGALVMVRLRSADAGRQP